MEDTKGQLMGQLQKEAGAQVEHTLAVGDGTADIDLFTRAGVAIAICPRSERVRQAAHYVLDDGDLSRIIPLLEKHFSLGAPA